MEMIGRQIGGRYRLIAPLGEGGMATIWRAVDEQLDREVAVKRIFPEALRDPGVQADTTWIDFATGTYDQAFSVGARDTALVQIPVDFNYSGLGAAAVPRRILRLDAGRGLAAAGGRLRLDRFQ